LLPKSPCHCRKGTKLPNNLSSYHPPKKPFQIKESHGARNRIGPVFWDAEDKLSLVFN